MLGTGAGLCHSGDLTDLIYANKVEVWLLSVMPQFDVTHYWRFRDDAIMLANCHLKAGRMLHPLQVHAEYFTVTLEATDREQMQYLGLMCRKQGNRIVTEPYIKPTNLGIPLSTQSCHPVHVHSSWPKAVIQRLSSLSSTAAAAEAANSQIVQRFQRYHANPALVSLLAGTPTGQCKHSQRQIRWQQQTLAEDSFVNSARDFPRTFLRAQPSLEVAHSRCKMPIAWFFFAIPPGMGKASGSSSLPAHAR